MLQTKRFLIRPLQTRDTKKWIRYINESRETAETTSADFEKAFTLEKSQAKADRRWEWKIIDRVTGEIIGMIDMKTVNRDPYQVCDVGYYVLPSRRAEGVATEAVKCAIPEIFRKLKFHRLEFAIEPSNKASLRVAKNLKLHREGLRKHYWPTNYPKPSKIWSDQIIFVITPEMLLQSGL